MPASGLDQVALLVAAEHVNRMLAPDQPGATGGLTTAQLVALTFVHDHPKASVKDLSAGSRVNHSAASQVSRRLATMGLLAMEPGEDRREARLALTPAGRKALAETRRKRLESLDRILKRMTPGDRAKLADGLTAFLRIALNSEAKADDACGRCWVDHFGECIVNVLHRRMTGRDPERVAGAGA